MGPYELLRKIIAIFERLHIPYIVTGSVAAMAYGEPRLTNDIDIVAEIREQHVSQLLEAFPPVCILSSSLKQTSLFQRRTNF